MKQAKKPYLVSEYVEPRVRRLVDALNNIAGIETFSSCGGHEDPDPGQMPLGEFSVDFFITKTARGWEVLDELASLTTAFDVLIIAGNVGNDYPGSLLSFFLTGGSDPDEIAVIIEENTK